MDQPSPLSPVCQKCTAWNDTTNPFIQSDGSENPDILFVGEAPGADEEAMGKPFVGKSGQLLRDIIEQLELQSYRITNAVRCRPPQNKLRGTEPDYCKKYLIEEILRCRPKLIVTLGAVPLKSVTGINGIMKVRSEIQSWILANEEYNPLVLPTVHPASTMYRPENLEYLMQDCELIPGLLERIDHDPVQETQIVCDTLEKLVYVIEQCLKTDRIAIDTETTGLNPYQGAEVMLASVSWAEGESAVILFDKEHTFDRELSLRYFDKILRVPIDKVFHNARFDIDIIETHLGLKVRQFAGDTMIAQFLADETTKRGLKYLTGRYLKIYNYDAPLQDWFKQNPKAQKQGMKLVPKELLYPYACRDADYTRRLSYVLDETLKKLGMTDLYHKHMIPLTHNCIKMRQNGIKIDVNQLQVLTEEYKKEIEAFKEYFNNHDMVKSMLKDKHLRELQALKAITQDPKRLERLLEQQQKDYFNPNSTKQVATLLFDYLHLAKIEGHSTSKHVLAELSKTSEEAVKLLEYRKKNKMYTAFLVPMPELMDQGAFVRPEVIPDGTRSGRTSCRNPNLQQAPWDARVRSLYCTRWEKGALYLVDYSQIELRVMAMMSGDQTMTKFYTELDEHGNFKDFHTTTAAKVYRVKEDQVESWQRRFIKTVNFGIAYGRGAVAIAAQFDLEVDYCKEIIQDWWGQFPQLRAWRDNLHAEASKNAQIRTPYGRRRVLPGVLSEDPKIRNSSLNAAINSPVQGTAADICNEAMNRCMSFIEKNNLRTKIIMVIHDSIIFDIPEDEVHYVEEVFMPIMESIRYPWMGKMPLVVEAKTARTWGEMEDMKMRGEWEGQSARTQELQAGQEQEVGEEFL